MATGNICSIVSTSTEDGWTCFNIGTMCIAFYYRQFEGVKCTTSWENAYRSDKMTYCPAPRFLDWQNANYAVCSTSGSQTGASFIGRVVLEEGYLNGYLAAHKSINAINIPILLIAIGQRV